MAVVKMSPVGINRIRDRALDFGHNVAKLVLIDVLDTIPIDTGAMLRSTRITRHRTGAPIWIGSSRVWVGTDHWRFTEYGVPPHHIIARRKKALANKKTGQIFGKEVNHPGIKPVAYMRRALYKRRVVVRWL